MKGNKLIFFVLSFISFFITSCIKEENIQNPDLPINRLFLSSSTNLANSTSLSMFIPTNENTLGPQINFNLSNPDGKGVIYDYKNNIGFQLGMFNKTIRTFSINTDGTLRILNNFRDTTIIDGNAITYNNINNQLFVASSLDSTIHIYNNASSKTGNVTAETKIKLPFDPAGISYGNGNLLIASSSEKAIYVINSTTTNSSNVFAAIVSIPNTNNLHAIAYSPSKSILVISDIGDRSSSTDGAIHIFEGINNYLTSNNTLVPNRTINGNNTFLGNPVSVSISEKTETIYVAENATFKILAFNLSSTGNSNPLINVNVTSAPQSIWIDAR